MPLARAFPPMRPSGGVLAVISGQVVNLAGGDPHDMDSVADHVSAGRFSPFRPLGIPDMVLLSGKHPTIVQCGLRGYMDDQLRQVGSLLANMPDTFRALLPWDVGQSLWLLWGSFALFVVMALILSLAFGWLCGWAVARLISSRS